METFICYYPQDIKIFFDENMLTSVISYSLTVQKDSQYLSITLLTDSKQLVFSDLVKEFDNKYIRITANHEYKNSINLVENRIFNFEYITQNVDINSNELVSYNIGGFLVVPND